MSPAPPRDAAVGRALHAAAEAVTAAVADIDGRRVVLVDGRSGAGKSTLARMLVDAWPDGAVQLLALEDVYPGWDGLDAGVAQVVAGVLMPYAAGRAGRWRRWDWTTDAPAAAHRVDPGRPLIVEGCGILTPASAALAAVRVWLDAPATSRRCRALGRDGDAYRPHWDRWAAQEARHIHRDRPRRLATHVLAVP